MKIKCTTENLLNWNKELSIYAEKYLNFANHFWFDAIKIIITLSPTFLLGSIAFAYKIILFENIGLLQKKILVFSWILFLVSTFFGIVTLLKASDFFTSMANETYKKIAGNVEKIVNSGEKEHSIDVDLSPSIKFGNLTYGIIASVTFLLGVLNTGLFLTSEIHSANSFLIIFSNLIVVLYFAILLGFHLKNRK